MKPKWLVMIYVGLLGGYSLFSYSQVDPNLVLSSRPGLWWMQQMMWQLGYHQRWVASLIYLVLVSALVAVYSFMLKALREGKLTWRGGIMAVGLSVGVLGFAYPALSHDIFNYLMNAKMVWMYHANPHIQVALDFPQDPWLSFMNNVHTTAPYYYGWTALSLIPSIIGQNHLKITILLFRLLIVGAFWLLIKAQKQLTPKEDWWWILAFALNPLVLIETVGNIHNDVVMMALVLWGIVLARKAWRGNSRWWIPAVILWVSSVSIKYASLMVLVGLAGYWVSKKLRVKVSFGSTQALAHFLPLLTARSQRFLPWYLIWPLSFLPLSKEGWVNETLILFSFTGLLAYIPYLYRGEYSPELLVVRSLIIFLPPLSYLVTKICLGRWKLWK